MLTFVFESIEVKKTGRIATRDLKNFRGDTTRKETMIEIVPIDEDSVGWKSKWVKDIELFTVEGIKDGSKNS